MVAQDRNQSATPLGRVFRLKELPGLVAKYMDVPPGRLGVVIRSDGTVRTFPFGHHLVLSAMERLRGHGAGLLAGYIPLEAGVAQVKPGYLLSGDRELLSARLMCAVEVGDAARFLQEVVVPQGGIWPGGIELNPQPVEDALAPVLSQFAAADIIHGRVDTRIASAAQIGLQAALELQGLRLQQVLLMSLTKAEDRAVIAEKAQALSERMQDVSLQAKMAEIENQAQLDDFLQQLDPELLKLAHLRLGADGSEKDKSPLKGNVLQALRGWFTAESSGQGDKRRWSIEGLFKRKDEKNAKVSQKPRHVPSNWWVSRVIWMGLMVLLGFGLTNGVNWMAQKASWDSKIEVILIIWGVVISVVLESLKALYEKRESLSEESWMHPGFQHLDNLAGNDRKRVDQLVRDQCAHELAHVREIMTDVRSREYKRGKIDLALKLKNELEQNLEDCLAKVQKPDYGRPPYMTDLRVRNKAWGEMLDVDEDLLLLANSLGDQAQTLQQRSQEDQLSDALVTDLNIKVSQFCNKFHDRGHPLQMPAESLNQK